jgi:hypothetical protein
MFSSRRVILLAIVGLGLYLLLAYAFYAGVASRTLGANDFYSRWMGARALFLQGQDPYSPEVTQEIQRGMYGRLARPDEDQVAFAYPLYVVFFVAPFVALPYAWAESFWIALLIVLVVSAGIGVARMFELPLAPFGLLALLAFVLTFYPALRGIFLGQFTLIVFASLAFGLACIRAGQDAWAGVILSATVIKPHIALIPLAVIVVWALVQRRWRLVRAWFVAIGTLVLLATVFLPMWVFEFVGAVNAYSSYITIGPPIQVLSEAFLPGDWARLVSFALSVVLLGVLVYRVARTVQAAWLDFMPTLELALIVTTMVMVRTATTDQTLLLVPWIHWLANLARAGRRGLAVLIGLGVVVIPWAIFLTTLRGNQEAAIATTGVVTLTLVGYSLTPNPSPIGRGEEGK